LDSQKLKKNRTTTWTTSPTSGFISKEMKSVFWRCVHTPCPLQHYLQYPRHEDNLNVCWWISKEWKDGRQ
jgi:hypothetical protein